MSRRNPEIAYLWDFVLSLGELSHHYLKEGLTVGKLFALWFYVIALTRFAVEVAWKSIVSSEPSQGGFLSLEEEQGGVTLTLNDHHILSTLYCGCTDCENSRSATAMVRPSRTPMPSA